MKPSYFIKPTFVLITFLFSFYSSHAQKERSKIQFDLVSTDTAGRKPTPIRKLYYGSDFDAYLLTTSLFSKPGLDQEFTVPRFTAFAHIGVNFYYDFSNKAGVFFGLGIKNVGFIEKIGDSTIKRRVYTLGVPVGFRFGNMKKRSFFMAGAGLDMPFHYKEKGFVDRSDKKIIREWFSDRAAKFLPYVYIGHVFSPGLSLKLQYYPANLMNPNFVMKDGNNQTVHSYHDYNVNLLMLSFGFNIQYSKMEKRD